MVPTVPLTSDAAKFDVTRYTNTGTVGFEVQPGESW